MINRIIRTIKAISVRNKTEGEIGFLTQGEEKWYNIVADESALDILLNSIIQKGNIIEFEEENGMPKNFVLKEKAEQQEKKNWTEDMTNYNDLLNAAHEKAEKEGIYLSMESKPQRKADGSPLVDFEKKTALYEATLTIRNSDGKVLQVFVDTGDAEGISNDLIKPHFNRMASTRAMARCYRIYTNNAAVSVEETDEEMEKLKSADANCRLIKGQVFLWEGAKDWHDLWDEDGIIIK